MEGGIGWNIRGCSSGSIGQGRRNDEGSLPSNSHALDTHVPALDHLTDSQAESKSRVLLKGIKLLSILETSNILDSNLTTHQHTTSTLGGAYVTTGLGSISRANDQVSDSKSVGHLSGNALIGRWCSGS